MRVVERVAVAAIVASTTASCIASGLPQAWIGAAIAGTFASPTGIAYDSKGGMYVTEWAAHRVTYIDPSNGRRLVTDRIPSPSGVAIGPDDAVYVSSYSDGVVYRLSPEGKPDAFVRGLGTPAGLSIGKDGSLLIADRGSNQILRADASGGTRIVAKGLPTPVGAVEFSDGTLVVSNFSGVLVEIGPDGRRSELTRKLGAPAVGIVADGSHAVLVPDYGGTAVWRVTRDGSATKVISDLRSPVAMARSADGAEIAVGSWGDGSLRRYRQGAAQ